MDCGADLSGESLKKPSVGRRELLLSGAPAQYQPSDRFASVSERQAQRLANWSAHCSRKFEGGAVSSHLDGRIG